MSEDLGTNLNRTQTLPVCDLQCTRLEERGSYCLNICSVEIALLGTKAS